MSQEKKYMYVQPHFVGNVEYGFGECYDTDKKRFSTVEQAIKHGMSKLEHDDFWVVEMEGDKAKAIFHSDGERRKNDTKEVAAINNEFGV
jgi:hypothetical protein